LHGGGKDACGEDHDCILPHSPKPRLAVSRSLGTIRAAMTKGVP
jgi:hypothetical protein